MWIHVGRAETGRAETGRAETGVHPYIYFPMYSHCLPSRNGPSRNGHLEQRYAVCTVNSIHYTGSQYIDIPIKYLVLSIILCSAESRVEGTPVPSPGLSPTQDVAGTETEDLSWSSTVSCTPRNLHPVSERWVYTDIELSSQILVLRWTI